ncbi:Hypothetical protein D9617_23g005630 [Elsinoe fawcettii]|nr:Hypothetical protein D9617_23g005630 [Elsinoe fawcettii]
MEFSFSKILHTATEDSKATTLPPKSGRAVDRLPYEILVKICDHAVVDEELLRRDTWCEKYAPWGAPHKEYYQDRLVVSAVCQIDRPFTLFHEEPTLCKVGGSLGRLARARLFLENHCCVMLHSFDYHHIRHLRDTIRFLLDHTGAKVENLDVRFVQRNVDQFDENTLAIWFETFFQFRATLSPNVTWPARYMESDEQEAETRRDHNLICSLARRGLRHEEVVTRAEYRRSKQLTRIPGVNWNTREGVIFDTYMKYNFDQTKDKYIPLYKTYGKEPLSFKTKCEMEKEIDTLEENEEDYPISSGRLCDADRTRILIKIARWSSENEFVEDAWVSEPEYESEYEGWWWDDEEMEEGYLDGEQD